MHRNVTLADGSRVIQEYTGASKHYTEPGWDAPHNWRDVMTLAQGEVALDFAQPAADVAVAALEDGRRVALTLAGTHFVLTPELIAEGLIPALTKAVAQAKANKAAIEADQAQNGP